MEQDIRWQHRLESFRKALHQLTSAVETYGTQPIDIIKEGTIQRFEFRHEMAWNPMKDYLTHEGFQNITGSRSATREAFRQGLIQEGQIWMNMLESRNRMVHTYNENILAEEYNKIATIYLPELQAFFSKMHSLLCVLA